MFRQIIANNRAGGWRKIKIHLSERAVVLAPGALAASNTLGP
jgi:hypothetical protein